MEADKPVGGLQALLNKIQKLYSGLVTSAVHDRVTTYHQSINTGSELDIGAILNDYFVNTQQHTPATHPDTTTQPVNTDPALLVHSSHDQPADSNQQNSVSVPNPLSRHLTKTNSYHELAPPVAEKLQASAWQHTQSAIRLAHQGNHDGARLHADLASNAVKELGHYLPDTEYLSFQQAIKMVLIDKL
jgi:hypothetical protein